MGINLSLGAIENAGQKFIDGAATSPTPTVSSSPPASVQPRKFQRPDVSAPGQVHAHHGEIATAGSVLQGHLPEILFKVSMVKQYYAALGSIGAWQQGAQFDQNVQSLMDGVGQLGQQTHDAHADTASNLKATAQSYSDAETDSTRAVQRGGIGPDNSGSGSIGQGGSANWTTGS